MPRRKKSNPVKVEDVVEVEENPAKEVVETEKGTIEVEYYTADDLERMLSEELKRLEELEKQEEERRRKLQEAMEKGFTEAEVVDITFGTFKDFLRPETIERFGRDPDAEAVRIAVENEELGIRVVRVYRRSLNENANWRKFLKRYGGKKKVMLKYDPDRKRWDILL